MISSIQENVIWLFLDYYTKQQVHMLAFRSLTFHDKTTKQSSHLPLVIATKKRPCLILGIAKDVRQVSSWQSATLF